MKNNFIVELIKTKNSKYFKISLIIPLIFLIFSLLTILTTTNSGGLSNGQSIIQSSIYNLWSFIILPVTIVLIINNDKKQENQALGHQTALANNWSLQKIYLSKIFKYWTLILLSQFVLLLVIQISNLLTVHQVTSINKNIFILFIIWLGIFPLIIINNLLLRYLNVMIVVIINIAIPVITLFFSDLIFSKMFFLNPWLYSLRTVTLLRINPNGTVLSNNSELVHDTSFIFPILVSVIIFLLINFLISLLIKRNQVKNV